MALDGGDECNVDWTEQSETKTDIIYFPTLMWSICCAGDRTTGPSWRGFKTEKFEEEGTFVSTGTGLVRKASSIPLRENGRP